MSGFKFVLLQSKFAAICKSNLILTCRRILSSYSAPYYNHIVFYNMCSLEINLEL